MPRHKVGDPSSKYAYSPEQLDADIADKHQVCDTALECIKSALLAFMMTDYRYRDGQPMSMEQKWSLLMAAARTTKERFGV